MCYRYALQRPLREADRSKAQEELPAGESSARRQPLHSADEHDFSHHAGHPGEGSRRRGYITAVPRALRLQSNPQLTRLMRTIGLGHLVGERD